MNNSLRKQKRTRGAAVVEAAVVLPVVVLLTFGIIELGWYVNSLHILHNAARQGARAAVRSENSNAEVEAAVLFSLSESINVDPNGVTVRISKLDSSGQQDYQVQNLDEDEAGDPIQVAVTINHAAMGPLSNIIGFATDTLTSSATMKRTGTVTAQEDD